MLTERQKSILDAVIREYVATAEPVASERIVKKYRPSLSPATVRNELLALDEAGFLTQPHTSAGRVPTDKGYRFFINSLSASPAPQLKEEAVREMREADDPAEFIKQASRILAHLTRNVALAGFPEDDLFYKTGLGEAMLEPEFLETEMMHEFAALVDIIDGEISEMFNILAAGGFAGPRVFVGRENPIREARRYGMIVSSVETPFDKPSLVALIGPKRMDYERNIAILKRFSEVLAR